MSYLETLTPAENLMLRDQGKAGLRGMLKCTLLDLILKSVLVIEEKERDTDKRGKMRRYRYVVKGPAFADHTALAHEQVFTAPYASASSYLLRNLVSIARDRAGNPRAFSSMVLANPRLRSLRKGGAVARFFGMVGLNDAGLAARDMLLAEIRQAEERWLPLLNTDAAQARSAFARMNGNITLLEGVDPRLLPDLDKDGFGPKRTGGSDDGSGSGGCGGWSGCGNDSGCGGGSGCGGSGCSGCGGCGGCS